MTAEYEHKQPRVVEGVLQALIEEGGFTVAPANKTAGAKDLDEKTRGYGFFHPWKKDIRKSSPVWTASLTPRWKA